MIFLKKLFILVLCLIFCFFLIQVFRGLAPTKIEDEPQHLFSKPKILAFYEEGWGGIYAGSWSRLEEVRGKIDLVSPVWLGLKADGKVAWDKTDTEALSFFHQDGLDFFVLVTAGSGRNGSSILASGIYRKNALDSVVTYIKTVNANGVCLDFEYLNPVLKEEFTQFIKELKGVLAGKKLFVTVFPYVDWDEPTKDVYDHQRLGDICDGVIVMTYDQHRPKDTPGPVASRDWVNENLAYFLTQIDARKLWLGIADYGYRWQTEKKIATALPAWYCREKAIKMDIANTYNPKLGNDFLQYTENGNTYTIWWEGPCGMQEKLALAAKNNLAGVALWRLGYEENGFWE